MFTIAPADADKAAALAKREQQTGTPSAMVLTVDGTETGYALFAVERDTVCLLCLRSQVAELEEWLLRAVLNAAANRLAITAVCEDVTLFPLLKRLHFAEENGVCTVFIPDFFNRPCCGGEK